MVFETDINIAHDLEAHITAAASPRPWGRRARSTSSVWITAMSIIRKTSSS
mgnify:CR=1 FL=1